MTRETDAAKRHRCPFPDHEQRRFELPQKLSRDLFIIKIRQRQ